MEYNKEKYEREEDEEEFIFKKETIKDYYRNYFPIDLLIKWLSRNNYNNYLINREFSFLLPNDHVIRYLSYKSKEDFKNDLLKKSPKRIDIGAIYNKEPKIYGANKDVSLNFYPIKKELVFDIDITDYDDIRTCCQNEEICNKCWKFLVISAKILKFILEENFGYKYYFFVFSGRRGIHCWVNDVKAFKLNEKKRIDLSGYLKFPFINQKNNTSQKRIFIDPVFPLYLDIISLIKNDFFEILKEQKLFSKKENQETFIEIIKMYFKRIDLENIQNILKEDDDDEEDENNSILKFNQVKKYLEDTERLFGDTSSMRITYTDCSINEFILNIVYPKFDLQVNQSVTHLLKCPFSIHPQTGFISLPLSIELMKNYSVENPLYINRIIIKKDIDEINFFRECVKYFEDFLRKLLFYCEINNNK